MKYEVFSRKNQRKGQIQRELLKNEKSFSEIFDILGKGNYSKSYLTDYLRELQEETIIAKNNSGKYFLLREDFDENLNYEKYKHLHKILKHRKRLVEGAFNQLLQSNFSPEEITDKLYCAIEYYLELYLTTLENTIRSPQKFSYLSWCFFVEINREFMEILSIYGEKNNQITENVLNEIKKYLQKGCFSNNSKSDMFNNT